MEPADHQTSQDETFNQVISLLIDCRFAEKRTRDKAEKAISLLEKHQFGSIYLAPRGLVCYPDLLSRYLNHLRSSSTPQTNNTLYRRQRVTSLHSTKDEVFSRKLYLQDLTAMISRCIENSPEEEWCSSSLKILLAYHSEVLGQKPLKLYLLAKKYHLDLDLYQQSHQQGIQDKYLDARLSGEMIPYLEPKPQYLGRLVKQSKSFGRSKWADSPTIEYGYRQAYHRLLYSKDLDCLVEYWKNRSFDCTFEAACDYFSISRPSRTDIETFQEGRLDLETQEILLTRMKS